MLKSFIIFIFFLFLSNFLYSKDNIDQWKDSEKTYLDLINEGFEIKAYDINNIKHKDGFFFLFFVTVLQKNNQVYECQEYQTLDENLISLDITFICRELVQPYEIGIGT
ncbi:MAG: hypothetical protein CFH19_00327 [Alphaproteobacteria bacterium MarineAlpha5_Bin9]|nr:MAG: hypothetical protein CFH19_00327 [Alphaproteobacteria bacterium MarineAlpha5_Bin9]|tara:strand:+ start:5502 stop:5828 length:327 start_codon:yes stop_codon:yes gene_type:complete